MDQDFLVLLYDVARMMRTRSDQTARGHGMTRAQWVILSRVARYPGLTQRELAALAEVEPITVARLVDRLEQHGLVERRPNPRDRRVWHLHVTAAAGPMLGIIAHHKAELQAQMTDRIDAETLAAMQRALLQMKANLGFGIELEAPAIQAS